MTGLRGSAPVRWWSARSRRDRVLVGSAGVLVVALGVTVVVALASGPAPRARQYLAFTACLLTDGRGVAGAPAASAWAGMQDASLATHAKVQYLPVTAGSTEGAAAPVLASLVARQCKVVAAGPPQVAAVMAEARHYPSVRFAVVGGPAAGAGQRLVGHSNVTVVTGAVRSTVAGLVTSAVAASGY